MVGSLFAPVSAALVKPECQHWLLLVEVFDKVRIDPTQLAFDELKKFREELVVEVLVGFEYMSVAVSVSNDAVKSCT
jgi:hypothetical protein